jgi:hypothetical protein
MLRPDNLIPLNSGAYSTRGLIASVQRCVNLYQEINPPEVDAPQSMTHYPRPGLISKLKLPGGRGRGVFTTSNGQLYAVSGPNVYYVDPYFQPTLLGQIAPGNNPVSISDNGTTAVLVDGTTKGSTITFVPAAGGQPLSNMFAPLVDPTGTFVGATRVDYADTFLVFNAPGTNDWYTSLNNQVSFNALVQAAKSSYPDPIQTIAFNIRQVWLIGKDSSEVWYLSGGSSETTFAYSEWPNIFIPYGTAAPYSLCQADIDLYWLSHNRQGRALFVKSEGYGVVAVSTRAIEDELSKYPTISDCISYSYQQAGHTFVSFSFPTADKTWVYDIATKQWHERAYLDNNGKLHRERVSFCTPAYDLNIGQDWETGELYALDLNTFTDNLKPIVCIRSFPHTMSDLKEITHVGFVADIAAGTLLDSGEVNVSLDPWNPGFDPGFGPIQAVEGPMLNMRYSNDGGGTWSNYRRKGLISAGHYRSLMRYRGLGMARDRVYELSWSAPMMVTLQGAFLDPLQHGA